MSEFIKYVNSDGEVEYRHKDYDQIIAQEVIPPTEYVVIPEEELIEWERTRYQRQRAPEYPRIQEQLDALFKAGVFPEEMASQIQAVKDKYPKP